MPLKACTSSAVSRPTSTTTWTRSWRRRSRPIRGSSGCRGASCSAHDGGERRRRIGRCAGAVGRRRVHREPRRRSLSRSGRTDRSCRPGRRSPPHRCAGDPTAALSGTLGKGCSAQPAPSGLGMDRPAPWRASIARHSACCRTRPPRQRTGVLDAPRPRLSRAARRLRPTGGASGTRGLTPTPRSTNPSPPLASAGSTATGIRMRGPTRHSSGLCCSSVEPSCWRCVPCAR